MAGYIARRGLEVIPTVLLVLTLVFLALRVMPGLASATIGEVRVGLRPTSVDDSPILGPLPGVPNVFVATGHGANGLLLGPYSAHLVAAQVSGRAPAIDITPFGVERFASDLGDE